jgi:hypothetical protein
MKKLTKLASRITLASVVLMAVLVVPMNVFAEDPPVVVGGGSFASSDPPILVGGGGLAPTDPPIIVGGGGLVSLMIGIVTGP